MWVYKHVEARVGYCLPPYGSEEPNSGFVRHGSKHLSPNRPLVNPVPILSMQEAAGTSGGQMSCLDHPSETRAITKV